VWLACNKCGTAKDASNVHDMEVIPQPSDTGALQKTGVDSHEMSQDDVDYAEEGKKCFIF